MFGSLAIRSSNALRASRSVTGQIANVSARSLSSFAVSRTGLSANLARTSVGSSFNVLGMSLARSLSQTAPLNAGFQSQGNPPNSSVFVGNLPWSATQEELQELFAEFGEVTRIRIHTQSDGRPRGFAHVEFASKDAGVACFTSAAEEPLFFGGRDLVIDYAKGVKAAAEITPNNRLYFTGMQAGESGLREALGNHVDEVITIYFLKDAHTGEPTETGFVEFKDISTATQALEHLKAAEVGERFSANYARPQKPRSDRNDRPRNPRMYDNNNKDSYSGRGYRSEGGNRDRGSYGRQDGGERGGYSRQDSGRGEGRSYGRS